MASDRRCRRVDRPRTALVSSCHDMRHRETRHLHPRWRGEPRDLRRATTPIFPARRGRVRWPNAP
jgi:hypothetical protein